MRNATTGAGSLFEAVSRASNYSLITIWASPLFTASRSCLPWVFAIFVPPIGFFRFGSESRHDTLGLLLFISFFITAR
jgi:hypothetical protein